LSRRWLGPWWRWDLYVDRWFSPRWTCLLRHRDIHKLIHHCFLWKCQIKNECQCWSLRERVIKVIPVDGALAGSEAEDCWVLVWNCTRCNLSEKK
jgi:hypothetical protein